MPKKTNNFIPFESPAELLALYDPHLFNGRFHLYPWQVQVMNKFADEPPKDVTNQIEVVAANDSGKSKMILAPCFIWHTCQFDKSETVLTSGSATQLDKQTARYCYDLARAMNAYHGEDLWTIQYRKLHFKPTDGFFDMFATDDALKAEGWHQRDFDAALCIGVDESKGVSNEIFEAIDRCHDAQRILFASSPSLGTAGYFYRKATSPEAFLVDDKLREFPLDNVWHTVFKITAFECPHISEEKIKRLINFYGIHSPIIRSMIFAEFTSMNEETILRFDSVRDCVDRPPLKAQVGFPKRVGIDLAQGGDENVISIFHGNVQIGLECFREPNSQTTIARIKMILAKYGIDKNSEYIFADDGGAGRPMIDQLRADGYNIKRVLNQSAPVNAEHFGNRGAELWFNFAAFVENKEVVLINDQTLIDQLSNRFYKQGSRGKLVLESKKEAKAKGRPSPDRADATVLAFTGLRYPHFFNTVQEPTQDRPTVVTQRDIVAYMEARRYRHFDLEQPAPKVQERWTQNKLINQPVQRRAHYNDNTLIRSLKSLITRRRS